MKKLIIIMIIALGVMSCSSKSGQKYKLLQTQENSSISVLDNTVWYVNKEFKIKYAKFERTDGTTGIVYSLYELGTKCLRCYTYHSIYVKRGGMKAVEKQLMNNHKEHGPLIISPYIF